MIYLDHNATTPILRQVREAMLPYLHGEWGNPSSSYRFGSRLKLKIEEARSQVANLIGSHSPQEIVFTSGGTEANNTAIHAAITARPQQRHIITSQVEHSSVLAYCQYLEKQHHYRVTYLPVDSDGLLSMADLRNAVCDDTCVVSLMWANNETGVLFPVQEIAQFCRSRGVLYHSDAVQAAGKLAVDVSNLPVDYLSITGHKIGAPKGIGALYVDPNAPFIPFFHGGHQESGRRGGTENISSVIGLGVAAERAASGLPDFERMVRLLRDTLEQGILATIAQTSINGQAVRRLANTTNIMIGGVDSDSTLTFLDGAGICASSGSACMESAITPSHVITAMTGSHEQASESLRFSLSSSNTGEEVATVIRKLAEFVEMVR